MHPVHAFGRLPRAGNQLSQVSYWFIGLSRFVTPKMTVNHNTYITHYVRDACNEYITKVAYIWLVWAHPVTHEGLLGIPTWTCKDVPRQIFTYCQGAVVTALSCAALVIRVDIQTVSCSLTCVATNVYFKYMRVLSGQFVYTCRNDSICTWNCPCFQRYLLPRNYVTRKRTSRVHACCQTTGIYDLQPC